MKLRPAIPAIIAALAALLAWAAFRAARPASGPVAPDAPSASAVPPPPKDPLKPAPAPARVLRATTRGPRDPIRDAVAAALKAGGAPEAYRRLRAWLDATPSGDDERRDRALALRCLPALARRDPSLRPEITALLRHALTEDADAWARTAAATALADAPLEFASGPMPYFWSAGGPLPEGSEQPDEQPLGLGAESRELLRGAFGREADSGVRIALLQMLAAGAGPEDRATFERALESDVSADARELALQALARLPWTPETRGVVERALQSGEPLLRQQALSTLVAKGVVDDLVVAKLLESPPATKESWDLIGQAWSRSRAPALAAFLRGALDSSDAQQRAGALSSIAASGDKSFLPFVEAARARESDASLKKLYPQVIESLR